MLSNKHGNLAVNMLNHTSPELTFKWVFFFHKLSILKCSSYETFNVVHLYKKNTIKQIIILSTSGLVLAAEDKYIIIHVYKVIVGLFD